MASTEPHPFDGVDLRRHPDRYRIGRGEYGLFHAEPYKSELLPLRKFRTPEIARASADAIWEKYLEYRQQNDLVGMDISREYLQMGYTRSRRYARWLEGRKKGTAERTLPDAAKQEGAEIFRKYWSRVREDDLYQQFKEEFQRRRRRS